MQVKSIYDFQMKSLPRPTDNLRVYWISPYDSYKCCFQSHLMKKTTSNGTRRSFLLDIKSNLIFSTVWTLFLTIGIAMVFQYNLINNLINRNRSCLHTTRIILLALFFTFWHFYIFYFPFIYLFVIIILIKYNLVI